MLKIAYKYVWMVSLLSCLSLNAGKEYEQEDPIEQQLQIAVEGMNPERVKYFLKQLYSGKTVQPDAISRFQQIHANFKNMDKDAIPFDPQNLVNGIVKIVSSAGVAVCATTELVPGILDDSYEEFAYNPWSGSFQLAYGGAWLVSLAASGFVLRDGIKDFKDPRRSSSYQKVKQLLESQNGTFNSVVIPIDEKKGL